MRTWLPQEVHLPRTWFARRSTQKPRSLEDSQFCVHRSDARRIAQLLGEVLEADDAVATCDGGAYLHAILGAVKRLRSFADLGHVRAYAHDSRIMNHESLTILIGDMIAAGRVECVPARTPWPLHAALWRLNEDAGRLGLRARLGVQLRFSPSSEVGRRAGGADLAFRELIRQGVLREEGAGLDARLIVDSDRVVARRRHLLVLDPEVVRVVQRAGERWAAFAATCAKYPDAPARSSMAIVASGAA